MTDYERKIKTLQSQVEAMRLLKESDIQLNNMRNNSNMMDSFVSETTLDFDAPSPWKKEGGINFAFAGIDSKE